MAVLVDVDLRVPALIFSDFGLGFGLGKRYSIAVHVESIVVGSTVHPIRLIAFERLRMVAEYG